MMTDHRNGLNLVNGLRAGTMTKNRENGPGVGMMYSRLERDPRVEMIRSRERGQGVGMTSSQDLARDLGAEMMNNKDLVRDLEVEMMSNRDLARGPGAETILRLIESRSILTLGQTPTQTTRMRTKV